MLIGKLRAPEGSRRNRKRLGRGESSGTGGTSGKGHKGQKARSGGYVRPGFEGGQMPLQRRLPKFGFTAPFRKRYNLVRLSDLNRFEAGQVVDLAVLDAAGIYSSLFDGVRLVATGTLDKGVTLKAYRVSSSGKPVDRRYDRRLRRKRGVAGRVLIVTSGAREAIERAGGKVEEN